MIQHGLSFTSGWWWGGRKGEASEAAHFGGCQTTEVFHRKLDLGFDGAFGFGARGAFAFTGAEAICAIDASCASPGACIASAWFTFTFVPPRAGFGAASAAIGGGASGS